MSNKQVSEILDGQRIAYGFISQVSAFFNEEEIGKTLGKIFLALNDFDEYIDKLEEVK